MTFASGHAKMGGRPKGGRNRRTLVAAPKVYPDALEHLATVIATTDGTITPELRLRAAIGLAAYQHPKPTSLAGETFVTVEGYIAPATVEEARQAILTLGERVARGEISIEAHDALIGGIKAYLSDRTAEQQRTLDGLEDIVRNGGNG
jgi:hypothetical protein